jgi:hypothetical protein
MKYALKIWNDLQACSIYSWKKEDQIIIIDLALKKQREMDARVVENWHYKRGGYLELANTIRNNKIEE